MTDEDIAVYHAVLLDWYDENKREFPWRYIFNPYKVFVSEILLQQTNVEKITVPYCILTEQYKDISELSHANIEFLREIFKEIGLFYRADRIISISKEIMNKYDGIIPNQRGKLIRIKGIGNYICNAILCFGYNEPYAVLDTNVIRIFERLLGVKSTCSRPREDKSLWEFAQMLLPKDDYVDYNYALLDFASNVCTARNPKCSICTFRQICCLKKN